MACLPSTCPFCACGCGVLLQEEGGRLIASFPSAAPPARSSLCIRGWHCTGAVAHPDRLTSPLVRAAAGLVPVTWQEAVSEIAGRLAGAGSPPCFAVGPTVANEDAVAVRELAERLGARLCASDLTGAPAARFALEQVPNGPPLAGPAAIGEADLVWLIGSDPAECPQVEAQVADAGRRGVPVVRVDVHRRPAAGSCLVTVPPDRLGDLGPLLHRAEAGGEAATSAAGAPAWLGDEAARAMVHDYRSARRPVVAVGARWLSSAGAEASTVALLEALAAAGGNGRVVFAAGESNSWGVLDVVGSDAPAAEIACRQPGVDTVLVVADDLVRRSPRPGSMADALSRLRTLVVIDRFMTDTAALADVVLPSCLFAETDGTVTNLFGELRPWRRAVPPPGDARPEREWMSLLASALESHGEAAGSPSDRRPVAGAAPSGARDAEATGRTASAADFPFLLVLASHPASFSTGALTSRDEILRREAAESVLCASPSALKAAGLKPGWPARLVVPDAEATLPVRSDPRLPDEVLMLVALPGSPPAALRGFHAEGGGRTVGLQPVPARLERA